MQSLMFGTLWGIIYLVTSPTPATGTNLVWPAREHKPVHTLFFNCLLLCPVCCCVLFSTVCPHKNGVGAGRGKSAMSGMGPGAGAGAIALNLVPYAPAPYELAPYELAPYEKPYPARP